MIDFLSQFAYYAFIAMAAVIGVPVGLYLTAKIVTFGVLRAKEVFEREHKQREKTNGDR